MIWKYCTEIRHAAGKSNPRSFARNVGIILLNNCVNFLSGVLLTLMHVVDKKSSTDGVIEIILVLFVIVPSIGSISTILSGEKYTVCSVGASDSDAHKEVNFCASVHVKLL